MTVEHSTNLHLAEQLHPVRLRVVLVTAGRALGEPLVAQRSGSGEAPGVDAARDVRPVPGELVDRQLVGAGRLRLAGGARPQRSSRRTAGQRSSAASAGQPHSPSCVLLCRLRARAVCNRRTLLLAVVSEIANAD